MQANLLLLLPLLPAWFHLPHVAEVLLLLLLPHQQIPAFLEPLYCLMPLHPAAAAVAVESSPCSLTLRVLLPGSCSSCARAASPAVLLV
jgi:hypothetical protein